MAHLSPQSVPFARTPLARSISLASVPLTLLPAQQALAAGAIEEVVVTASRRSESVQDIPINITAVSDTMIQELRLDGIAEIARYVPGLTVIDRGPRDEVPDVMVRGLNTTGLGPGYTSDTVATYFSEIPLAVDFKPVDMERVEVLIGPQGTLYGKGTLGGAIRYIPKKADPSSLHADLRAKSYINQESDDVSFDAGVTVNLPIVQDKLALRANFDRLEDEGFIDYNYVVREAGVSDPEPDFGDPAAVAANLRQVEDANGEQANSLRLNLRYLPTERIDANLWYMRQKNEAEGRQISNQLAFDTGKYESAYRYEEPNNYENEVISAEVEVDLDFAALTAVYGETEYEERGQRDQTDLLLDFEYGYEFFPTFSAFTRELASEETTTWELRLASQHGGPVSWIVGYFDNEIEYFGTSEEFTPGFDQFAVDNFGGVQLRPDSLEYYSESRENEAESAVYGEVAVRFLQDFEFTVGYRSYEFEVDSVAGFALPLFDTVFLGDDQDAINIDLGDPNTGSDKGDLFKYNLAWNVTDDTLLYATYSEGYRNGGVNSVPECTQEQIDSDQQQLCALEDEILIDPDTIDNYELGMKGLFFDSRLSLNLAVFYIDWQDLQVATTTENGSLPIIGNGSAAESRGVEMFGRWLINDNWDVSWTYAYTEAELTDDAPGLVGPFTALDGTRLPGHAKHQGTLNVVYSTTVFDDVGLDVNYGVVYSGNVFNIPGGDEDPLVDADGNPADRGGEAIDSYDVHHLAATFQRDNWSVQAFVDNLWNEYYVTGTRTSRRFLQNEQTGPGNSINGFTLRSYGAYVGLPRNFGVRFTYSFDG